MKYAATEILDAEKKLKEAMAEAWVDINEVLPRQGERVLLYDKMFDRVDVSTIYIDPKDIDLDYTHWMPAPSKPVV